jgi:hypothetical protein
MNTRRSTPISPERKRIGSPGGEAPGQSKKAGYKLLGEETIPKSTEILDPTKDTDKVKIRELNEDANSNLIMSINTTRSAAWIKV